MMRRFDWALRATCARNALTIVAFLMANSLPASADEQTATLALDRQAFIAYGDAGSVPVPAGSTIRFRLGAAHPDGSIAIAVRPDDLSIAPIALEGATIQYTLREVASGTLRRVGDSRQIELLATLVATLRDGSEAAPVAYQLRFTTGTAEATNAAQTEAVSVSGAPAVGSNHVKLVGAATNEPDAFPGPGEAVYAVLSGTFDWLPSPP